MPLSVHDVAAELRQQKPGAGRTQLHALVYYCQGHHLAHFDEPLFAEPILAGEQGPVAPALDADGPRPTPARIDDNGVLNTIGYVLSRYGTNRVVDLRHMMCAEEPWQRAMQAGVGAEIEHEWMAEYFARPDMRPGDDSDEPEIDMAVVKAWLKESAARPSSGVPDDLDKLRARIEARAGRTVR